MNPERSQLPLNALLTKKCNYSCPFCVEDTVRPANPNIGWEAFAADINHMAEANLVTDVLLLGGEPLYYPGIIHLIDSLKVKPIITTNGARLVKEPVFFRDFQRVAPKIRALNISLPHYSPDKRSELSGTGQSFSNESLAEVTKVLSEQVGIRVNTLLMKNYIDSSPEIEKMAALCEDLHITELKVGELTGRNPSTHDFLSPQVLKFNGDHYVPIPDEAFRNKCHTEGGTFLWKKVGTVSIFFNAPPDAALSGGRDKDGRYYHRVMFEDGLIGYSWNREKDGVSDLSSYL